MLTNYSVIFTRMELTHILGYAGALLTGLVLGLLGGGGALLSIPVLVYLFKIEASVATGYSLFLVAVTASFGAVQNIRRKFIDYNGALYYGVPSVITVFIVRRFILPNLPKVLFYIGSYPVDKNHLIMFVLCTVMFIAGYKMITATTKPVDDTVHEVAHFKLGIYAVLIGLFLGLVGAGGGFLMVPALIYFANTPTKKAIGTSLMLVAINSFMGFIGDVSSSVAIDWKFLFNFSVFSVTGVIIGNLLTGRIQGDKLKVYFGWFVLLVGIGIAVKELFF